MLTNNKARTRENNRAGHNVKFMRPNGSTKGAIVCISINNAPYIRVECKKDCINFTASETTRDDGCFYSEYLSGTSRIYVPEAIVESYTDYEGRPLIGRAVPRKRIKNGYSLLVKRMSTVKLPEYLSYEDGVSVDVKAFKPVKSCNAATLNAAMGRIIEDKQDYTVGCYLGKTAGIVVQPGIHTNMFLSDWHSWFGGKLQHCLGSIQYSIPANGFKTFAPAYWTKQFSDDAQFTIGKRDDGAILVQCESKCIVDNATTHSAEFNSGTKYICSDCVEESKKYDSAEIAELLEGVIGKYEEAIEANRVLTEKLAVVTEELAAMTSYVSSSESIENPIVRKVMNQEIQKRNEYIAELERKLDAAKPIVSLATYKDFV